MDASLRPLHPSDLARVAEIERHTFSDPWSAAAFQDALAQPHVRALAAVDERGAVLGYTVGLLAADEAEVLNIAVDPPARGKGVGAALLEGMLEELRRAGARSVFLEVRRSNEAAIRLYRRSGFEILGARPDYYRQPREDALTMGRFLGLEAQENDEGMHQFG
ncbi:MAG: ribosomal-protein-alanine N-acetyltransferase [Gemmatimonadetes bacterium GWC2_71_9]|nr:MAG: ribosomal-protein-alanine N-acetyltransferase [Gemmatimonadetes bacterium GWC2_71_9]OGT95709.1 MAG: ribosomal-protein-alanine N-acetyltransferase [Gemmatimonadetes bacterium RIFCSPLOWO2_02_FULL_71_11]